MLVRLISGLVDPTGEVPSEQVQLSQMQGGHLIR
jgi:hypothetical protein